ncbi:omega toxin-like domain protein [Burkholderia stabilis]|uniref:omega toxin-like domain protein n=1 Tax=Burkholderia stabilis TaxID=95485 RepID=UPI0011472048|nr:omega toxin-like domain protein [Burkholderia stabilis]
MNFSSLIYIRKVLSVVCGLTLHQSRLGNTLRLAIWTVFALVGISVAVAKDAGQNTALQSGQDIANSLNSRYLYMVNQCPDGKPAYYCSGITIRATAASNGTYHEWDPSPTALLMGSVSFSYVRGDTGTLKVYHDHGFIFKNNANFDVGTYPDLSYRCIYPNDAATDDNTYLSYGCMKKPPGDYKPPYIGDVSSCGPLGIKTSGEWISMKKNNDALSYNCSFSTEDPVAFYQALQAAYQYKADGKSLWTELLIETWPDGIPDQLPIEAFFYTTQNGDDHNTTLQSALENAKAVQEDFCKTTGRFVPIVKLDFTAVHMNIFSYSDQDQTTTCSQ